MDVDWKFLRAVVLSLLLHCVLIGLLLFSVDSPVKKTVKPIQHVDIVKAVSVDKKEVDKELKRLKDIENEKNKKELDKQKQLEKKLKELQDKSAAVEKKRKNEQKKLADLKKKKVAEQKKREDEQKKLAKLKKEQADIQTKKKQEEEKQRKEAEERKKLEDKKKREDEERKKKEVEEKRRKQELAEEQKQQEAAQRSRDQKLLQNIVFNIKRRVVSNFNKSGLPKGLECVLSVQLVPGGKVIKVSISQTSGHELFDRRALGAVQKASPLPVPEDAATLDRLKLRQFAFRFRPED